MLTLLRKGISYIILWHTKYLYRS